MAKLQAMELHRSGFSEIVQRRQRATVEVLQEAVDQLNLYKSWLEQKVEECMAAAGRGEMAVDDEVRAWMERRHPGQV
jgi:predicted transcriptional regulator